MSNEKTESPVYCRSISPTFPNPRCLETADHEGPHWAVDKNGNPWLDWTVSQPEPQPGLSEGDRVAVVCEPQRSGGHFAGEWRVLTPAWAGSQFLATIEKDGQQAKFYERDLQKVGADQ